MNFKCIRTIICSLINKALVLQCLLMSVSGQSDPNIWLLWNTYIENWVVQVTKTWCCFIHLPCQSSIFFLVILSLIEFYSINLTVSTQRKGKNPNCMSINVSPIKGTELNAFLDWILKKKNKVVYNIKKINIYGLVMISSTFFFPPIT